MTEITITFPTENGRDVTEKEALLSDLQQLKQENFNLQNELSKASEQFYIMYRELSKTNNDLFVQLRKMEMYQEQLKNANVRLSKELIKFQQLAEDNTLLDERLFCGEKKGALSVITLGSSAVTQSSVFKPYYNPRIYPEATARRYPKFTHMIQVTRKNITLPEPVEDTSSTPPPSVPVKKRKRKESTSKKDAKKRKESS